MIAKFAIWLMTRIFKGKNRSKVEPCIRELYRIMAINDLKVKTEIVKVKKGARRYNLMFVETPKGKIKFNLSRHWEDSEPKVAFLYD